MYSKTIIIADNMAIRSTSPVDTLQILRKLAEIKNLRLMAEKESMREIRSLIRECDK